MRALEALGMGGDYPRSHQDGAVQEKADTKQEHSALSHMTSDPTTAIVGIT